MLGIDINHIQIAILINKKSNIASLNEESAKTIIPEPSFKPSFGKIQITISPANMYITIIGIDILCTMKPSGTISINITTKKSIRRNAYTFVYHPHSICRIAAHRSWTALIAHPIT
jgi:hypothetical protein